jgi:hypothetical protein
VSATCSDSGGVTVGTGSDGDDARRRLGAGSTGTPGPGRRLRLRRRQFARRSDRQWSDTPGVTLLDAGIPICRRSGAPHVGDRRAAVLDELAGAASCRSGIASRCASFPPPADRRERVGGRRRRRGDAYSRIYSHDQRSVLSPPRRQWRAPSRQHRPFAARRDRARPIARSDRRLATPHPRWAERRARASIAAVAYQRGARRAADVDPARRCSASDGAGRRHRGGMLCQRPRPARTRHRR